MNKTTIDITEHLEEYVRLLEASGIPRSSTESKLMLIAKEEIETLRKTIAFLRDESNEYNKSRLRYMDCLIDIKETGEFKL